MGGAESAREALQAWLQQGGGRPEGSGARRKGGCGTAPEVTDAVIQLEEECQVAFEVAAVLHRQVAIGEEPHRACDLSELDHPPEHCGQAEADHLYQTLAHRLWSQTKGAADPPAEKPCGASDAYIAALEQQLRWDPKCTTQEEWMSGENVPEWRGEGETA